MHMAMEHVLRLILVQQQTKASKTLMAQVLSISDPQSGCMGYKNIKALVLSDYTPQFPYTLLHLLVGILMRPAAVFHTAAQT